MGNIAYDIYEIPNMKGDEKKYRVRVVRPLTRSFEDIKKIIHSRTSFSPGGITGVTERLSTMIVETLSAGERMHIDGIGYFNLAININHVADGRKITAKDITVTGINFTPDKKLVQKIVENCTFEKASYSSQSAPDSAEEIIKGLIAFFEDHNSISRFEFQHLFGMTKATATRRLNALCGLPEAPLRKDDRNRLTCYYPTDFLYE